MPQTPTGTEFLSPSKNISCEIDYNFGPSSIDIDVVPDDLAAESAVLKTTAV